jgi:hypothetical protein
LFDENRVRYTASAILFYGEASFDRSRQQIGQSPAGFV